MRTVTHICLLKDHGKSMTHIPSRLFTSWTCTAFTLSIGINDAFLPLCDQCGCRIISRPLRQCSRWRPRWVLQAWLPYIQKYRFQLVSNTQYSEGFLWLPFVCRYIGLWKLVVNARLVVFQWNSLLPFEWKISITLTATMTIVAAPTE